MLRPGLRLVARRAAFAGATVAIGGGAAALCEPSTASVPKFVLGGERYDQKAFSGRLQKIQELIDVRTAFTTDEQLDAAQAQLAAFKNLGALPEGVSDADMWHAQKTVDAVIHAPTGEKMWMPGRMSMFVPMNVPPVRTSPHFACKLSQLLHLPPRRDG